MVDDWLLEHLAKVTTLSCVLIVIYFLFYSIWRISQMPNYPWNWNEWQWPIGGRHAVEIHRKPTEMPFTLSLDESSVENMGVCTFTLNVLKEKEPPDITVMWGAAVPYLMRLIHLPWHEFNVELMKEQLGAGQWESFLNFSVPEESSCSSRGVGGADTKETSNFFVIQRVQLERPHEIKSEDKNSQLVDSVLSESYNSVKFRLTPPIDFNWNLLRNQFRYPAAIFVTGCSADISTSVEPVHAINGIIQFVHVKNEIFSKTSSTLAQIIKMNNGQSHFLQPLYVMDDHRADDDSEPEDHNGATINSDNNDISSAHIQQSQPAPFRDILCSVCQVSPVTRVIIPCRHVCLCTQCFEKVETCPICRGSIAYYFKTRQEPTTSNLNNISTNGLEDAEFLTWWQRLERFNERFSDAIGLIRQY